jgi:hypothetical protein
MIRDRAIRSAQQAGDAGDFEERERILNRANDQLESLLGRRGYLKLTPQSRRAAREAAESPVLKRMREAAGKQLGTFRNPSDTIE